MNRLVEGDLVHQTALFLETLPLVVFGVAKIYVGKSANRSEATIALDKWRATGKFDKDVENFCLDVLSKRVSLKTMLKGRTFQLEE